MYIATEIAAETVFSVFLAMETLNCDLKYDVWHLSEGKRTDLISRAHTIG